MSSLLREYPNIGYHKEAVLSVTATMQGEFGRGVQFMIDDKYVILAENQVKDLVGVLTKRLVCEKGYSATDWPEMFERVEPITDKTHDVKTLEML